MKRTIFLFFLLLFACARTPEGASPEPVDPNQTTLYVNGVILTMDERLPTAEVLAVRSSKIEAVGSNEIIQSLSDEASNVIDLNGRVLMPGFVDAHTHILNDARSQGMSLDEAQALALRNGITTLGDLYVDPTFLREIQAFDAAGFLRARTGLYLVATDPCGKRQGDWWLEHPPTRAPGEMLRINGVKVFTDGGSCGRVALSFELEPGMGTGDLWFNQDDLNDLLAQIDAAGYQLAVHAIGDRAVVEGLNAFELVLDGRPNLLRHRMEHVSVIPPEALSRFGELGIIPVLMGEFPSCTPYGPPVPAEYGHMEWPWRDLRAANPGLALAWHSDFPFQSINPFDHILGFATRIDKLGSATCPPRDNPWLVGNTLPVEEALSIMTIQSAYALWREEEIGSLVPGKFADFIVLESNPLAAGLENLADNRVLLTVVGGRIEYCWPQNQELCPGFTNRRPVPLPDTRPPVFVRWLVAVLLALLPITALILRNRYSRQVFLVGGWAGLAGGASWFSILYLNTWANDTPIVFILGPFMMALGVAGLAARWQSGWFGHISLWASSLGAVLLAEGIVFSDWFRNEAGWGLVLAGILLHTTALFLYGLANLRARSLDRGNVIPALTGLLGGLVPLGLSFILPESSEFPWNLLIAALGGGWALMGVLILLSRNLSEN